MADGEDGAPKSAAKKGVGALMRGLKSGEVGRIVDDMEAQNRQAGDDDARTKLSVSTTMTSSAANALGPLVLGGGGGRGRGRSSSSKAGSTGGTRTSLGTSAEDSQTQLTVNTTMTSSAAAALGPLVSGGLGGRGRSSSSTSAATKSSGVTSSATDDARRAGRSSSSVATDSAATQPTGSAATAATADDRKRAGRQSASGADDTQTRVSMSSTATSSNAAMLLGPLVAATTAGSSTSGGASSSSAPPPQRTPLKPLPEESSPGARQRPEEREEYEDSMYESEEEEQAEDENPYMEETEYVQDREQDAPVEDEEDDRADERRGLLRTKQGTKNLNEVRFQSEQPDQKVIQTHNIGGRCIGLLTGSILFVSLTAAFIVIVMPAMRRTIRGHQLATVRSPGTDKASKHNAHKTSGNAHVSAAPKSKTAQELRTKAASRTRVAPEAKAVSKTTATTTATSRTTSVAQTTAAPRTKAFRPSIAPAKHGEFAPHAVRAKQPHAIRAKVTAPGSNTKNTDGVSCANLAPGDWVAWSTCAVCGGGIQSRARAFSPGCPQVRQKRPCSAPAFVLVSDWSAWSECGATCGAGLRARTRTVNQDTMYCDDLPVLREESLCRVKRCTRSKECPRDVGKLASDWTEWGACSKTCGGGTQIRNRVRLSSFASCAGRPDLEEIRKCNVKSCAEVNCRASPWGEWGRCEPACGPGMKQRFRRVDLGQNKVNRCPDLPLSQKASCFGRSCSGHCTVGTWSLWTDCSTSCGEGQRERRRLAMGYPRNVLPKDCPRLVERRRCGSTIPCAKPCTGRASGLSLPHVALQSLKPCDSALSYQSCQFSCVDGFTASSALVCLDGELHHASAQCAEAACEEMPMVKHSTDLTVCAGAASGAICTITCLPGYAKSGDATCFRGSWSHVTCQALQCRRELPQILHAAASTGRCATWALQAVSGSACPDFACKPGFRASGTLRCEDGNWIAPQCLEEPCTKPPEIKDASYLEKCANQPAGAICEFQCAVGKLRTAAAVCSEGVWSDARCVSIDCMRGSSADCPADAQPCKSAPRISVDGKQAVLSSCAGMGSGGMCQATKRCDQGLQAVGGLICDNGRWIGDQPRCEPLRCEGPPIVEHSADLGSCVGLPSGSLCIMSCLPGFVRGEDAVCTRGRWTRGRCDPLQCTNPPVVDHGVADEMKCSHLTLWATCPLECKPGYVQEGELRCLGAITSGARCIPAPCRSFPDVAYSSDLESCAGAPTGAVCAIHCLVGYAKTNDAICSRGTWSKAQCQRISCGQPPPIAHADANRLQSCAGITSAERCTSFVCKDGFMKSTELVCTQGFFNNPRCVPTSCQAPPRNVEHSEQIHCSSRGTVKICKIKCTGDRVKSGDVVCADGAWRFPRCMERKYAKRTEAALTRITFSIKPGRLNDFLQLSAQAAAGVEAVAGVSPGRAHVRHVAASKDVRDRVFVDMEIWPPAAAASMNGERRLADDASTRPARAAVSRLTGWAQLLGSHIDGAEANSPVAVKLLGYVAGTPCVQVPQVLHSVGLERCAPALSGSICALQCTGGFKPTADLVCSDGDWEQTTAQCEEAACSEAPSVKGVVGLAACRGYPSGAVCPVRCSPGYKGTGELVCNRGTWVGRAACVPESCAAAPAILHSAPLDSCAGMSDGQVCQPLCQPGYSPTHTKGIMCRNGNWKYPAAPSCMRTGCYSVPAVSLMRSAEPLMRCVGTPEGQRCDFQCGTGFEPVGVLMCIQGVWSKPACMPRKCMAVPHIKGALDMRRCKGTASGRICQVSCPIGQEKTGDLLCLHGEWQNQGAIRCNDPGQVTPACSRAPFLADADTRHCAGTLSGNFCDPCIPGYQLDGPLLCSAGSWSDARCMPKDCQQVAGNLTTHAEHWAMCRGTAATGGCALQCKSGFSPAGRLIASSGSNPDELMRASLICEQGMRFMGPSCLPAPCQSHPALAHAGDLRQCIGTASGGSCDGTCLKGFELAGTSTKDAENTLSSIAYCSHGRWLQGGSRCREATCGLLPGHAQGDAASRCKGTASQQFCDFDCAAGLALAAPLLCRRGSWAAAGDVTVGSTCRGFCIEEPPVVGHVTGDLRQCTPMEAGGHCPISCKAGHLASGSLICHPQTLQWNLVTCGTPDELANSLREVRQSFQVAGVQARDSAERRYLVGSFLRGLSRLLRLSTHLMHMVLEPHTSSLPPAPTQSAAAPLPLSTRTTEAKASQLQIKLRVSCLEHQCEHVLQRLHLAGREPKVFDATLASSICEDRCIPAGDLESAAVNAEKFQLPAALAQAASGSPGASARAECLRQCPEANGKLQTIYRREPVIMATQSH